MEDIFKKVKSMQISDFLKSSFLEVYDYEDSHNLYSVLKMELCFLSDLGKFKFE